MSSEHDSAYDQEIPDRETADAAKWLSENLDDRFDTPTFWLIAGLLVAYTQTVTAERDKARQLVKVSDGMAFGSFPINEMCVSVDMADVLKYIKMRCELTDAEPWMKEFNPRPGHSGTRHKPGAALASSEGKAGKP